MARAILVSGDEERFENQLVEWHDYLLHDVGISDITFFKRNKFNPNRLHELLLQNPGEPILLIYSGHGGKGYWAYHPLMSFGYKSLAEMLRPIRSPIYIINDCCYSFSIVRELTRNNRSMPIGLLAGGPGNKWSLSFLDQVLKSWQRVKIFRSEDYPQTILDLPLKDRLILCMEKKLKGGWPKFLKNELVDLVNKILPEKQKRECIHYSTVPLAGVYPKELERQVIFDRPRWGEVFDSLFFPQQLRFNFD